MNRSVIAAFDALVEGNPLMGGPSKAAALYWGLSQVLGYGVPGDLVELGCNKGHTSAFLQTVNEAEADPPRRLHLYDSFAGLPAPAGVDGTVFAEGQLQASVNDVESLFAHRGLTRPIIHPGWFDTTLDTELPPTICFAYLDADLFDSIAIGLRALYPRLSPGGLVLIDDYSDPSINPHAWDRLPGVRAACEIVLRDVPEIIRIVPGHDQLALAYFRKA